MVGGVDDAVTFLTPAGIYNFLPHWAESAYFLHPPLKTFFFFLLLKCSFTLSSERLPAHIIILHMGAIRGVPACFPALFVCLALGLLKPTLVSVTPPLIPDKTVLKY